MVSSSELLLPPEVLEWRDDIVGAMSVEFSRQVVGYDEVRNIRETIVEIVSFADDNDIRLSLVEAGDQQDTKLTGYLNAIVTLGGVVLGNELGPDTQYDPIPLVEQTGRQLLDLDFLLATETAAEFRRISLDADYRSKDYLLNGSNGLDTIVRAVRATLQSVALDAYMSSTPKNAMRDVAGLLYMTVQNGAALEDLDLRFGRNNFGKRLVSEGLLAVQQDGVITVTEAGKLVIKDSLPVAPYI